MWMRGESNLQNCWLVQIVCLAKQGVGPQPQLKATCWRMLHGHGLWLMCSARAQVVHSSLQTMTMPSQLLDCHWFSPWLFAENSTQMPTTLKPSFLHQCAVREDFAWLPRQNFLVRQQERATSTHASNIDHHDWQWHQTCSQHVSNKCWNLSAVQCARAITDHHAWEAMHHNKSRPLGLWVSGLMSIKVMSTKMTMMTRTTMMTSELRKTAIWIHLDLEASLGLNILLKSIVHQNLFCSGSI